MVRLFIDIGVTWLYSVDEGGELLMNNRIKEVRKHNKLTQSEFANRLNVSQNYIYMIEKGDRQPSDRTISDICREFNVNEQWLRDGIGNAYIPLTKNQQILSFVNNVASLEDNNFKKRLVKALSEMSDEGWDALEKFIDSINEK